MIVDAHFDEYHRWLHQDVHWIITEEEKKIFIGLANDEERDEFMRQFWERRNPNPDSAYNKFKEEHYRRLGIANSHFETDEPGWKTDRGHVYIVFGPPDSIQSYPASRLAKIPSDIWHYRSIQLTSAELDLFSSRWRNVQTKVIEDFDFKFVDECGCGRYKLESPWPSPESGTIPRSK